MCGALCRDFLHFSMRESTQKRLTSAGRNPYNGNRNHVGQWNRSNFGMNNTEAFEFLLSWKDDVLMNCLSGGGIRPLIRRPCRRSGRPVPCWPRTGPIRSTCRSQTRRSTVRSVPGSPTCCANPEPFRHERCIYFPQTLDILCNLHYHKAIKCLFREASRTNKREPVPFCLLCSFLFPLRKRACCGRQKIRRFLCWM